MIISAQDIATYLYCPFLYTRKNGSKIIARDLSFFESKLKEAFIEGENKAVMKDSVVTTYRLARAWDEIWFPAAARNKITLKETKDFTLKATIKFTDYCKYDISDYTFPTAGTNISIQNNINGSILLGNADLVKIDMTTKKKTTVIVNFTTLDLDNRGSSFDIMARVNAYCFFRNKGENVSHIYVNIDENKEKLKMVTSTFSEKDMEVIRKMIYHAEEGIRSKRFYHNPYLCKECNQCPNITL